MYVATIYLNGLSGTLPQTYLSLYATAPTPFASSAVRAAIEIYVASSSVAFPRAIFPKTSH